ncbi:MAG TPA: pentapeptide repeat-containing protein [Allocoleopsis sp.]
MTNRIPLDERHPDPPNDSDRSDRESLQEAQDSIYKLFKDLVVNFPPESILVEFKNLFIFGNGNVSADGVQALYKIILTNDEGEFVNTLKRVCYILINNWLFQRKYSSIQELIQVLAEVKTAHTPLSPSLKRLRTWLLSFIESEDYKEFSLFASPDNRGAWSHRYTSYLLVPQYLDSKNPKEQRELARTLSNQLKEQFKLNFALYTARSESPSSKEIQASNPTQLGEELIHLIKKIISKNALFDYTNQSHFFLQQTRELDYHNFKLKLKNYLCFYFPHETFLEVFHESLAEKIDNVYEERNKDRLNIDLLLRTCRQVVEWLTTEDGQNPSYLFVLLTTQGNTITLAIILLKIILICQYVRTHLEVCIAHLIRYYEQYPERECQWFINFIETFNIVFALYTENVQYNLVKVRETNLASQPVDNLESYRVFSQFRGYDLRGNDLSNTDLRHSNLSAADLREANLSGADLSQSDLSLAKLSKASLSHALLNEAESIAADLSNADLSNASLIATKLRYADLQEANLSGAKLSRATLNDSTLSGADLRNADLQYADLRHANLTRANLSGANLQYADLSGTQLNGANLSSANLQYANLSRANLEGANLSKANLSRADLECVNLRNAELQGTLLRHVKLSYAKLNHANLSQSDLSHAELSHGDLSDTNLRNALLRHVNLNGADLKNADLRGANVFSTNLHSANIQGALLGEDPEGFDTFLSD